MEALVILGIMVGAVAALAYMARTKTGPGDASDIAARKDIPRRPARAALPGAERVPGGPGYDLLDDRTGEAGVRPRE